MEDDHLKLHVLEIKQAIIHTKKFVFIMCEDWLLCDSPFWQLYHWAELYWLHN